MSGDASLAETSAFAVDDGRITTLDPEQSARETIDARSQVVLPGFVDCHTHALYAGERMQEHSLRLQGASYEEIARAGGGILSTVKAVRAASEDQLVEQTRPRLMALAREGVTTVEIKSGYGLSLDSELKMLRAIRRVGEETALDVIPTFLGAHTVPSDQTKSDYLELVIETMLPAIAEQQLATAVDIYVESVAFDLGDLESLFQKADQLGLARRAHTEQLSNLHGSAAAAALGALSCDHLEHLDADGVDAMAQAGTVAVLLPGAFYFLRETRVPPIELLRERGVPMAVATDLNPGTSPIASLLTVMHMAATLFRLTPEEVLLGVTRHAARAGGRVEDIGSLEPGKWADFAIWDIPGPEFLVYQLGGVCPTAVYRRGRPQ